MNRNPEVNQKQARVKKKAVSSGQGHPLRGRRREGKREIQMGRNPPATAALV